MPILTSSLENPCAKISTEHKKSIRFALMNICAYGSFIGLGLAAAVEVFLALSKAINKPMAIHTDTLLVESVLRSSVLFGYAQAILAEILRCKMSSGINEETHEKTVTRLETLYAAATLLTIPTAVYASYLEQQKHMTLSTTAWATAEGAIAFGLAMIIVVALFKLKDSYEAYRSNSNSNDVNGMSSPLLTGESVNDSPPVSHAHAATTIQPYAINNVSTVNNDNDLSYCLIS